MAVEFKTFINAVFYYTLFYFNIFDWLIVFSKTVEALWLIYTKQNGC